MPSNRDMKLSVTKVRSIDPDQPGPLVIHYHTTLSQCAPLATFWSSWPGLYLDMKKPHSASVTESLYIAVAQCKSPPSSQAQAQHPNWPLSKTQPGYSLTWQMNKTKQDSPIAQLSVWDDISNVDVHIVHFNTPWRTHINTLTFHSRLINTLQRQKEFPTLNHRKAVGLMLSRWKFNAKNQASRI